MFHKLAESKLTVALIVYAVITVASITAVFTIGALGKSIVKAIHLLKHHVRIQPGFLSWTRLKKVSYHGGIHLLLIGLTGLYLIMQEDDKAHTEEIKRLKQEIERLKNPPRRTPVGASRGR